MCSPSLMRPYSAFRYDDCVNLRWALKKVHVAKTVGFVVSAVCICCYGFRGWVFEAGDTS